MKTAFINGRALRSYRHGVWEEENSASWPQHRFCDGWAIFKISRRLSKQVSENICNAYCLFWKDELIQRNVTVICLCRMLPFEHLSWKFVQLNWSKAWNGLDCGYDLLFHGFVGNPDLPQGALCSQLAWDSWEIFSSRSFRFSLLSVQG